MPPLGRKEKLTLASVLVGAPMLALALTARQLFALQGSAMFGATGLRGFVTGRIRVKGRVGPEREYTGPKAYLWAALDIFFGVMIAGLR